METVVPLFNVSFTESGGLGRFDLSSRPQAVKIINRTAKNAMSFIFCDLWLELRKILLSNFISNFNFAFHIKYALACNAYAITPVSNPQVSTTMRQLFCMHFLLI